MGCVVYVVFDFECGVLVVDELVDQLVCVWEIVLVFDLLGFVLCNVGIIIGGVCMNVVFVQVQVEIGLWFVDLVIEEIVFCVLYVLIFYCDGVVVFVEVFSVRFVWQVFVQDDVFLEGIVVVGCFFGQFIFGCFVVGVGDINLLGVLGVLMVDGFGF